MADGSNKAKTSFSLSEDAKRLLTAMARKLGISQTAVLELAIRDRARAEGVTLPDAAKDGEA